MHKKVMNNFVIEFYVKHSPKALRNSRCKILTRGTRLLCRNVNLGFWGFPGAMILVSASHRAQRTGTQLTPKKVKTSLFTSRKKVPSKNF